MTGLDPATARPFEILGKRLVTQAASSSSFELVFCKVCNQPTVNRIRCGVLACEACKKFFQRNRENGDSLRCVSGTFDCPLSDDRAALTSSGTVWRLVCPRCRLAKCLAVGMRVLGRKTKLKQQSLATSPLTAPDAYEHNSSSSSSGGLPVANGTNGASSSSAEHQSSSPDHHHQQIPTLLQQQQFNNLKSRIRLVNDNCQLPNAAAAAGMKQHPIFNVASLLNNCSSNNNNGNNNNNQPSHNHSSTYAPSLPFPLNIYAAGTSGAPTPVICQTPTGLPRSQTPLQPDNIRNEELLNLSVHAAVDLSTRFQNLPLRANVLDLNNDVAAWMASMQQYGTAFRNIASYAKQLPGNEQLTAEDRCLLYGNAISPISVAQNLNNPAPFGMNSVNFANFVKFFPEFAYSAQESNQVSQTLNQWKPSQAEYSLLLALLLYQNHPGLSNPGVIQEVVSQLNAVHQSCLAQQYPNDPAIVEQRIRQLSQIIDMVRSTATSRIESYASVKARRPDLMQMAPLYSKVYARASNTGNNNNNTINDDNSNTSNISDNNNNNNNNNGTTTAEANSAKPPSPQPSTSSVIR